MMPANTIRTALVALCAVTMATAASARKPKAPTPTTIAGSWQVARVTSGERSFSWDQYSKLQAKAEDDDCVVTRRVIELIGDPNKPEMWRQTDDRTCFLGGLGSWVQQHTSQVSTSWTQSDDHQTVQLPTVKATTRIRRVARKGDTLGSAAQWVGPLTQVPLKGVTWAVKLEKGTLKMTSGHQTLILTPTSTPSVFDQ